MTVNWRSRKLKFWASEPFEFGFERNPNPLSLTIINGIASEPRHMLLVSVRFIFKGEEFGIGIIRNRYKPDDHLLDLLEAGKKVTVGGEFLSLDNDVVRSRKLETVEDANHILTLPMKEKIGLIGEIELVP